MLLIDVVIMVGGGGNDTGRFVARWHGHGEKGPCYGNGCVSGYTTRNQLIFYNYYHGRFFNYIEKAIFLWYFP